MKKKTLAEKINSKVTRKELKAALSKSPLFKNIDLDHLFNTTVYIKKKNIQL